MFGYGGYTLPTVGMMRADWEDNIVEKPTIYEHCISDADFNDGWSETLSEGDNVIAEDKQQVRAISVPDGYRVVIHRLTADADDDAVPEQYEIAGPTNEDCFAEQLRVSKIEVIKLPTCDNLNREQTDADGSEYLCGDCSEGYVLDEDEESDTFGECIEEDNTLLYGGIAVAGLLVLIAILK